MFSKSKKLQ